MIDRVPVTPADETTEPVYPVPKLDTEQVAGAVTVQENETVALKLLVLVRVPENACEPGAVNEICDTPVGAFMENEGAGGATVTLIGTVAELTIPPPVPIITIEPATDTEPL